MHYERKSGRMKNASDFPGLYDDLFDFANAGYAMIDVENPMQYDVPQWVVDLGYTSPDPTKFWMKGFATRWHVTARGPLDPKVRQAHVKAVLEDVELPESFLTGAVETFPSPYSDEQYDCLVLHIDDDHLFRINEQLALLPGVQTYIPYKPHVTVGYFQSGHSEELEEVLFEHSRDFIKVLGFDYGRMAP